MRRWTGWRETGARERRFQWFQGCGRNKERKVKVNEVRRFKGR